MKRDALVVGINHYPFLEDNPKNPAKHLQTPAPDAEAIAHLLETRGDFEVHRLPAKQGVKQVDDKKLLKGADLQAAIRQLFCPQSNSIPDTALLFFAGHGLRRNQDGETEGFLATSEASPRKNLWGISLKWLRQVLQESRVRQQIIWLDCCHSGELLNFTEAELGEYQKGRDRCLIVASRDFQVAYGDGEHGMLTNALLQSLDPANRPDGWVTNFTLVDRVRELLKAAPQHPVCTNTGGQIILTGRNGVLANICPYKGLAYFDWNEEDPKYFYGRTRLTNLLLDKVQSGNFLAVLGASGSGKSSVVRAGLLYQLQLGEAIPGSDGWKIYPPFTPGDRPLQRLKEVVGVEAEQLEPLPLIKAAAAERVVLVVDQFEEVFTQCRDDGERQQFFKCLLETLERTENKLCLVLVMRSDFFGKCTEQEYSGLANKIQEHLVTVMPMNRQELEEAITKPAQRVDLEVERELVTQMIADVEGSPGILPLMQYTLTELWERKRENRLMISHYTQLGGVKQALEKQANKVYESFSLEEQQIAKWIFLSLTRLGEETEDTRKQVRKQDLISSMRSQTLIEKVIERLADVKLIVTRELENEGERVAVVDIAHEALIRHWSLLRSWLDKNREAVIRKQDLEDAAEDWRDKRKTKDSDYLLRGTRLAAAEDYLQRYADSVPLSILAQEFIQRSVKRRRNNRFRLTGTVTGVIVSLLGLTSWALVENENAQIRALNANSVALFTSDKTLDALIESIKAARRLKQPLGAIGANAETRMRVVTALNQAVYTVREYNRLNVDFNNSKKISFSSDFQKIALPSGNTIKILSRNGELLRTLKGHSNEVNNVIFSHDDQIIASWSRDGKLIIWSFEGKLLKTIENSEQVNDVSFSPDSQVIASLDRQGIIKLWNRNSDFTLLKSWKADYSANKLIFSPDSQTIVSFGSSDIKFWGLNGSLVKSWSVNGAPVMTITFSPDGQIIALVTGLEAVGAGGEIGLISRDGKLLKVLRGHSDMILNVSFSPDSQIIASASADGTIKLWNRNGDLIETLKGHNNWVRSVIFSPDGQTLASTGEDGTLRFWNRKSVPPKIFKDRGWMGVGFSPNGETIALITKSGGGTVSFWSRDGHLLKTVEDFGGDISFSSDGQFIASGSSLGGKVSFSLDGKNIVVIGNALKLWSLNGTLLNALQFDQKFDTNNVIRLFSRDGKEIKTWTIPSGNISDVSFSPDGQIIASANSNGTIILWGRDGKEIKTWTNLGIYAVSFSPDSQIIASANSDGTVKLWSRDGKLLKTMQGHTDAVESVSFSPDGKFIASGSDDRSVKLWSLDGTLLHTFRHNATVLSVSFSPDGKTLASGSRDGTDDSGSDPARLSTVILWNLDLDDLLVRGCDYIRHYLKNPNVNLREEDRHLCEQIKVSATTLIDQGRELAQSGDIQNAVAKFKQALKLDSSLKFDPTEKARRFAVQSLLESIRTSEPEEAVDKLKRAMELDSHLNLYPNGKQVAWDIVDKVRDLVNRNKIKEAITAYEGIYKLDKDLIENKSTWYNANLPNLCFKGSLLGYVTDVMTICEKSVYIEVNNPSYRYYRGVNHALKNNISGAINDFNKSIELIDSGQRAFFVNTDKLKLQQQRWLTALRNGNNPFTKDEIASLLNEMNVKK